MAAPASTAARASSRPAPPPHSPGEPIAWPSLTLWRQLGRGSFATTWLGELGGRPVVAQVFHEAGSPADVAAFAAEAATLATAVGHPNVLPVAGAAIDSASSPPRAALVYDGFLPRSLRDALADAGFTPSLSAQLELLRQVAAALCYLHAPGQGLPPLVHGDVRASSCFLDSEETVVRVAQYGMLRAKRVARRGAAAAEYARAGHLAHVGGLVPWTAPELLSPPSSASAGAGADASAPIPVACGGDGGGTSTPESDAYAYGMLAYELLARRVPFEDVTAAWAPAGVRSGSGSSGGAGSHDGIAISERLCKAVLDGRRPTLALLPVGLPEQLRALMQACWSGDPASRPTMADVLEQLTR